MTERAGRLDDSSKVACNLPKDPTAEAPPRMTMGDAEYFPMPCNSQGGVRPHPYLLLLYKPVEAVSKANGIVAVSS
jgi:hypothetical protein